MSEARDPVPAGEASGVALAAFGYCALLLLLWLGSAEILRSLLGDRPRLLLVGAQLLGILLPALALTRVFSRMGFPPTTSKLPKPKGAALGLALPGIAVSGYLVAVALNVAWLELLRSTGWTWVAELERFLAERYRELLIANSGLDLLGVLLMVSLVPAVCEELAFRRGLQGLLASRLSGPSAVVIGAIVFSAFHLEPFGLPTRFFLGLSLGIVYHRTRSLWYAGLLHAAHNLAAVAGILLAAKARGDEPLMLSELEGVPMGPVAMLGALGLVGWVVSVQLLRPPETRELEEAQA